MARMDIIVLFVILEKMLSISLVPDLRFQYFTVQILSVFSVENVCCSFVIYGLHYDEVSFSLCPDSGELYHKFECEFSHKLFLHLLR